MITLSNCLSFLRAPLALVFLQDNSLLRVIAIVLAMVTDSIDGYLARRYRSASKFGAILDPAMDKFFVYFCLTVLYFEGSIFLWEVFAVVSRDFFLCIFGIYLIVTKQWKNFRIRPVRWGKVTTAMQFVILIGITLGYFFPWYIYSTFILFGALAFLELFRIKTNHSTSA